MKHFLSVSDAVDIPGLIRKALEFKSEPFKDENLGRRKTLGLIFLNPSLRTRLSTQVAAKKLGLEVIVFNADKDSWQLEYKEGAIMNGKTVEHVKEAAAVLGQYVDILGVRSFPSLKNRDLDYSDEVISSFVRFSGVPVISLESATLHPLQSLADAVTIKESWSKTSKPKIVLTWAPHVKALPQSVPNSFAQWINRWDEAELIITHPEGYELDQKFSGKAKIEYDQDHALKGADFVYVKNWSSYSDYGKILNSDPSWMLTNKKLNGTNNAKVMHCLPVRRNVVMADEVLDGQHSIIVEQSANRVWATQAVLAEILKTSNQNR